MNINAFLVLSILFIALAIISFYKIRKSKGDIEFTWHWTFPIGAFVWEDLFVFSIFFTLVSLLAFFTGSYQIGLLLFFIFWLIRSLGESRYFMLQQFIQPDFYPHNVEVQFKTLEKIFGKISKQQGMIIMQVIHQTVAMIALFGIILILF